jgi:SOS-response transcriptional repressor LexA
MPYALTQRQKEVLNFIRQYIAANESSPRLEEIAAHLSVTLPTAHTLLEALQSKGYLYFSRSKTAGFFIRLIERAGSPEIVMEVPLVGKVDRYGEVHDFPTMLAHFPSLLLGAKPDDVFALVLTEDIPQANMQMNDFILFDMGKKPQPGDVMIGPIGERLFLLKVQSKTFDRDTPAVEEGLEYPIPEALSDPTLGQELIWYPMAYTEALEGYFLQVAEEQRWPIKPLSPGMVLATALRLVRALSF